MKENAKYIVGIDLGTTNSALAFSPLGEETSAVMAFPIAQLVAAGEVFAQNLLPSSLYLLEGPELPRGSTTLPWTQEDLFYIVGEFARRQGALVPGRLVQSAKSWLSYNGVDRSAPILPWSSKNEWIEKLSPVEAQTRFLVHIKEAWNQSHENDPLHEQEIVLTVPASFDDIARTLTVEASKKAGLGKVRLLEEPQAAFYSFLLANRKRLQDVLGEIQTVLVIDIGGGTTDFSLIEVLQTTSTPKLRRIAVGDHILLGGDNMDQALARIIEERTVGAGKLDGSRFWQLVQQCRLAKETLFENKQESVPINILARGSRLLGKTFSTELTKTEVEQVVLEGFFPKTSLKEDPKDTSKGGLKELGLPYAKDPAIPKYLAAFLSQTSVSPDAILLNGGVLKPKVIAERILSIVNAWYPQKSIGLLDSVSFDLAVARGASVFGLTRRGIGVSIGGGSPREYYVGIESENGTRGLCVVPKGSEEGIEIEIDRDFALRLGRPVRFSLFTTTVSQNSIPGSLVELKDSFRPLPPIQTVLEHEQSISEIRVNIRSMVTEVGTLELFLAAKDTDDRWRLEFQLRESSVISSETEKSVPANVLQEAQTQIKNAFKSEAEPRDAKGLGRAIEKTLHQTRSEWSTPLCRDLFDMLHERALFRKRSPEAEAAWFNVSGFLLRPGFGSPLDDWRVNSLWKLFQEALQYKKEKQVRLEWWIFWRRISGGLTGEQQEILLQSFEKGLRSFAKAQRENEKAPARNQELEEVIRLAANLEYLSEAKRSEIGELLLQRAETFGAIGPLLWGVGRIGARVLFYGSAHQVMRPSIVERWLQRVLSFDWNEAEGAAFAAMQLTRRTGDRDVDLPEELRQEVVRRLENTDAPSNWSQRVKEVLPLDEREQSQVFGERLPPGLQLLS